MNNSNSNNSISHSQDINSKNSENNDKNVTNNSKSNTNSNANNNDKKTDSDILTNLATNIPEEVLSVKRDSENNLICLVRFKERADGSNHTDAYVLSSLLKL